MGRNLFCYFTTLVFSRAPLPHPFLFFLRNSLTLTHPRPNASQPVLEFSSNIKYQWNERRGKSRLWDLGYMYGCESELHVFAFSVFITHISQNISIRGESRVEVGWVIDDAHITMLWSLTGYSSKYFIHILAAPFIHAAHTLFEKFSNSLELCQILTEHLCIYDDTIEGTVQLTFCCFFVFFFAVVPPFFFWFTCKKDGNNINYH